MRVMTDWDRPLTRALALTSGERLATLHDAAGFIVHWFGTTTRSAPMELAVALLFQAAESGTRDDRKAATDQLELALRLNVMLLQSPRFEGVRRAIVPDWWSRMQCALLRSVRGSAVPAAAGPHRAILPRTGLDGRAGASTGPDDQRR